MNRNPGLPTALIAIFDALQVADYKTDKIYKNRAQ
jgi:hypothetical protein